LLSTVRKKTASVSPSPFTQMCRDDPVRESGLSLICPNRSVSFPSDVLLMLERFIEWVNGHDGVEWVPMIEIERDFRARTAVPEGARMPKGL
jgi:hypothetical protein